MAKRTTPRNSSSDDQAAPPPSRTARPRTRKAEVTDAGEVLATADDIRRASEELPNIPEPGDAADQAQREQELEEQARRSISMGSEPSEDDIRLRAYERYLERGGGHGRHFDDWVEAERELRGRRQKYEV